MGRPVVKCKRINVSAERNPSYAASTKCWGGVGPHLPFPNSTHTVQWTDDDAWGVLPMSEILSLFDSKIARPEFIRAGGFGTQGSGKSVSFAKFIIGAYKFFGSTKPVLMLDTEAGSSWVAPLFEKYNVPLLRKQTRSYNTLVAVLAEFDKVSDFLFIDSITHFWKQFMEAYKKTNRSKTIRINDWGVMKPQWNAEVVNSIKSARAHVFITGRESVVFADEEDDQDLKPDGTPRIKAVKVGERMSAEGELGYDLDLLIQMTKVHSPVDGGSFEHRALVVKDKNVTNSLEGKEFIDPGFKEFMPFINFLDRKGDGTGHIIDFAEGEELHGSGVEEDKKKFFDRRDRDGAVEEFETIYKEVCKGPNQARKNLVCEHLFGTPAFENKVKKSPAHYSLKDVQQAVRAIKRLRTESKNHEKGVADMTDDDIRKALDGKPK
jgi:hypothetical protein